MKVGDLLGVVRAIEKWDGKMPLVVGGVTPFVDVAKLNSID